MKTDLFRHLRAFCLPALTVFFLSGCFSFPLNPRYKGPVERPPELEVYYGVKDKYGPHTIELTREEPDYNLKKIKIQTSAGDVDIDYYQRHEASPNIVFVFPVLGGKPVVESYFAAYFARHGMDAAIVHRKNDFKNPDNVDRLEDLIRENVLRDRYAIDFFEKEFGKKEFGSFGISRGAINAAITAGIDKRLKHNVLVLGGSDLVNMFKRSTQNRIQRYVETVTTKRNLTRQEFFTFLEKNIKTDPKFFASYIDARHTLMILGLFDSTVPIKYGRQLKKQIGDPKTIYLMADHYVSLFYTGFLSKFAPINEDYVGLPFDYVETEAISFYRNSMNTGERTYKLVPLRLLQIPLDIIGRIAEEIF